MDALDYRYPPARVVLLRNRICPYCRADLSVVATNKDHVIGRRFVPRGTLQGSWNLLLRVCVECNLRKAGLEDRISAASMHPPLIARNDERDSILAAETGRKRLGSLGPRQDRGLQRIDVEDDSMPGVHAKFGLVAPPSANEGDILQLAWSQISAFFYFITPDAAKETGEALPGVFRGVQWAARSDWGNARHLEFMRQTASWELMFGLDAARGYFKAAIRRHPSAYCWAWALEWNANYRMVGFFGDGTAIDAMAALIPKLELSPVGRFAEGVILVRTEVELDDQDDTLFRRPAAEAKESPMTSKCGQRVVDATFGGRVAVTAAARTGVRV